MAKVQRAGIALALVGVLGWLGSCTDEPAGPGSGTASLTVTPQSATLLVQKTVQLSAAVRDASGTVVVDSPIEWTSANPAVATVDSNGLATGIAPGSAVVIATSAGASDTAAVTVTTAPESLVVSDPLPAAARASGNADVVALAGSTSDGVVYVSLAPGSVPTGRRAIIRRVGDATTLSTAVLDGGFDPLSVGAQIGDLIEVIVEDAGGVTVYEQRAAVRASRPPVVVRTDPPRDKTDVPVNASIIIVFSEPVDGGTLTPSSVRLLRGTSAVSGTVRLLDGRATAAVFVPSAPLGANTVYRLEVTQAVRDLDGDVLQAGVTVSFTTGEASLGPPASIQLSPDSVLNLFIDLTYDISATIRDTAGNVLVGQTVTWSSSDPSVATVAPAVLFVPTDSTRGRVTAVSPGSVTIIATSGTLSATSFVTISAPPLAGVAAVTLSPDSLTLPALDGWRMTVKLWDANGVELVHPPGNGRFVVTLSSSNLIVRRDETITSNSCGWSNFGYVFCQGWNEVWIQPVAEGSAMLIATSEGVSDTAVIIVGPRRGVASLRVVPSHWTMQPQETLSLRAHLQDADGKEITWLNGGPRPITWTVDNPTVATVDTIPLSCLTDYNWGTEPFAPTELGTITRACVAEVRTLDTGSVTVTVDVEGLSTAATIAIPRLAFASVTAGGHKDVWYLNDFIGHTCGTTVSGVTVCWGGDRAAVGDEWLHTSSVPWALSGARAFTSVSAGDLYTCGLIATGEAYCWGSSIYLDRYWEYWELGRTDEPSPVPGAQTFVSLDAGAHETCGLTATGTAYCWDWPSGNPPVAVSSPPRFVSLSVGGAHACALTSDGTAYCWGSNASGQLGDGSLTDSPTPVEVGGGHRFVALEAGAAHTCGLDATGDVYCWGSNSNGQLGVGAGDDSRVAAIVSGGLEFVALSRGGAAATTCGITADAAAYCWGHNAWGQVGDGSTTDRFVPTPVAGGLTFASMSTGERHTCGVTPAGVAYCWGWNAAGQLGDGTALIWGMVTGSSVPVRVAGQP